ncbi:stage II sporulation protein D [Ruminococcus albus]|uniref:Stage II sporulation protein D n=1 Tax=Ruminococcus albus TaxID=1264 RepID=A0A1I1QMT2_RUMAL|nr:stage II sporulation protein D [Ruminococcus albus]SFD23416.1 stage II sporulation protein D [Ruminococcus albus]
MRSDLQCAIVLTICMALIPCLVFTGVKGRDTAEMTVGVYMTAEDKVEEYSLEDYIVGAVLSQMPADFSEEALKAQAVLARTYIYRRSMTEEDSPTKSLHGALISDDEHTYQSFFTPDEARKFYGENYKKARSRVLKAVRAAPWILTYQGEPITPAYHSASSGMTESALCAWGQDIPYLQPADSISDTELKGIESTVTLTLDDMCDISNESFGITLTGSPESWLTTERNKRDYVTSVTLGGTAVNVQQFVSAFGIASPCFTYETSGDTFVFTAKGFGHMVGMSQYGANSMAENGSSCEEILAHYFKNCTLKDE